MIDHSNYSYNNAQLNVELFFSLHNLDALERVVRSGTSLNINFTSSLYESSFFYDEEIQTYITGWQIRYEALSNEYILYFENQTPRRSHDLGSLLSHIFTKKAFNFKQLVDLDLDDNYYLNIHINLQQATTPPWLESSLFFWAWDKANLNYHIDLKLE